MKKQIYIYLTFSLCLTTIILLGCSTQLLGGKTIITESRKFLIEAQPLKFSFKSPRRPYNYQIEIKRLNISRLYDRDRIVQRLSDVEIRENRQHVWSGRPSEMLTNAIEQYFKESNIFINASQEFLDIPPDYVLTGTVNAIEQLTSGRRQFARLSMSMQITDSQTNQIIWNTEFDAQPQVQVNDIGATVQTMRDILHQNMEESLVELDFRFLNISRTTEQMPPLTREQYFALNQETDDPQNKIPTSSSLYEILPGKRYPEDR